MQKVIVGLRKFICVCVARRVVEYTFGSFLSSESNLCNGIDCWLRRRAHGMPIRCWGDLCFLNSTLFIFFDKRLTGGPRDSAGLFVSLFSLSVAGLFPCSLVLILILEVCRCHSQRCKPFRCAIAVQVLATADSAFTSAVCIDRP